MTLFGRKVKRWHFKALKACCAFFALFLLLGVVYTQHQPYKFNVSFQALHKAFLQDDVEDVVSDDPENIWDWFHAVVERANEDEIRIVEANCAYDIPKGENVAIDNASHTLYDPSIQDHACENPEYVKPSSDGAILSGNHEILTFGMFQARSKKKISKEKSQGNNRPGKTVLTPSVVTLDPMTDERVIELCHIESSKNVSNVCLSRDGFKGTLGSTLQWSGKYWDDLSRPAFEDTYDDRYIKIPRMDFDSIRPCYTYDAITNTLTTDPDVNSLRNCDYYWVTEGSKMRTACLLDLNTQPTSMFAYIATSLSTSSVSEASDLILGCSTLINSPSKNLSSYIVTTPLAIQNYLHSVDMYGTFFLTDSNLKWIVFAQYYAKQLRMHQFIDTNTRDVIFYTVLRNLGDEDLFYALVTVRFLVQISGKIVTEFDIQYVPIIQYYYGLDGYPKEDNEVLVAEALFLVPLSIALAVLTTYKIYCYFWPQSYDDDKSDTEENIKKENVIDPYAYTNPPSPKVGPLLVDEDKSYSLDGVDLDSSASDDSGIIERRRMQHKRSAMLKKMDESKLSDVSLKEFSDILLPDVAQVDNISSSSDEDDDDDDSDVTEGMHHDLEDLFAMLPAKSVALLKKQASFVRKQSTKTVKRILQPKRSKKYKKYFTACVFLLFVVGLVCRVLYIDRARELHIFLTSDELTSKGSQTTGYDDNFEDIIDKFQNLWRFEVVGRTLSVVCVFFFLTQFFSYLTFDKRFSLVTTTLEKAVQDIVPMLIILGSVLFTYSVLGSEVYGQSMEEFANVGTSMSTLLIIMLGEVQTYDDMKKRNLILTMFYFWSFVILVVFILFNMVLALIFTLYDEEYRDVKRLNEEKRLAALEAAKKRRAAEIAAIKRRKLLKRSLKARKENGIRSNNNHSDAL